MRILVLGGTGFIGHHIAVRLVASGHKVTILHRGAGAADSPKGVGFVQGDRNQLDRSAEDFRRLRPDLVIDCIAFTQQQAESLVDVFRGVTKRVVVLSSGDVYLANDLLFARITGTIEPTP